MREAGIRDSVAVIQYFHWLEDQVDGQNITELKGVEKLKSLKRLYSPVEFAHLGKYSIFFDLVVCFAVNSSISGDQVAPQ